MDRPLPSISCRPDSIGPLASIVLSFALNKGRSRIGVYRPRPETTAALRGIEEKYDRSRLLGSRHAGKNERPDRGLHHTGASRSPENLLWGGGGPPANDGRSCVSPLSGPARGRRGGDAERIYTLRTVETSKRMAPAVALHRTHLRVNCVRRITARNLWLPRIPSAYAVRAPTWRMATVR
jgi:hypothetical protein